MFDTFRSQVNATYGLADPDDPARARDVSLPNYLAKLQADASRKGNARKIDIWEAITTAVRREVDAGRVTDRRGVERYLERLGFTFTRRGEDYVTVVHPDTRERIRLKGGLYSRVVFNAREAAPPTVRYGVPDPGRAVALAATLAPMVETRDRFHQQRYVVAQEPQDVLRDVPPPGHPPELLHAYIERHLGVEALHAAWRQHRQRGRIAVREPRRRAGKEADDRPGAAVTRRLAAFGDALSGAGRRYSIALADLDRASGRLERAGGGVAASAAGIEDPWGWLNMCFMDVAGGMTMG
jgi:hypothetical protein